MRDISSDLCYHWRTGRTPCILGAPTTIASITTCTAKPPRRLRSSEPLPPPEPPGVCPILSADGYLATPIGRNSFRRGRSRRPGRVFPPPPQPLLIHLAQAPSKLGHGSRGVHAEGAHRRIAPQSAAYNEYSLEEVDLPQYT